jgi:hypothetical protein
MRDGSESTFMSSNMPHNRTIAKILKKEFIESPKVKGFP